MLLFLSGAIFGGVVGFLAFAVLSVGKDGDGE